MKMQKFLQSVVRVGAVHALHRSEYIIFLQNLHGGASLALSHRAVVDRFPLTYNIASHAGDEPVKLILKQRPQHTVISSGG